MKWNTVCRKVHDSLATSNCSTLPFHTRLVHHKAAYPMGLSSLASQPQLNLTQQRWFLSEQAAVHLKPNDDQSANQPCPVWLLLERFFLISSDPFPAILTESFMTFASNDLEGCQVHRFRRSQRLWTGLAPRPWARTEAQDDTTGSNLNLKSGKKLQKKEGGNI